MYSLYAMVSEGGGGGGGGGGMECETLVRTCDSVFELEQEFNWKININKTIVI
jgi:hypothetical protein